MSLSRKDYELIAETINTILWLEHSCPLTIARLVGGLGIVFAEDNLRFSEETFRVAALRQRDGLSKFQDERKALGL